MWETSRKADVFRGNWFLRCLFGDAKKRRTSSIEWQILAEIIRGKYMDDPGGTEANAQQRMRWDARAKIKPCPVRAPVPWREELIFATRTAW